MKQSYSRSELIQKIMETIFASVEINLYLDTHPEDQNAIKIYNSLVCQFKQAKADYESKYGPLTNFGYGQSQYPWQWICEPWPWDNEFYQ